MPTTTNLALPYPALSSSPNVPSDMAALAGALDAKIGGVVVCTSSTRPTAREGAYIYETDTDRMAKYTGSAWEYQASSRVAYTPTLTAATTNPTMGTAAIRAGVYSIIPGPYCLAQFWVQFGTSGASPGSGAYSVSLPFTAADTMGGVFPAVGTCMVRDVSGGTTNDGSLFIPASTPAVCQLFISTVGTASNVVPWTWANGDWMTGNITFPI